MYKNLFKNRYPELKGRDWIRSIDPDDLQVFVHIGLEAADHGKLGGKATARKYGKQYMREIARRGALVTNLRRWWKRMVEDEEWRLAC